MSEMGDKAKEKELLDKLAQKDKLFKLKEKAYQTVYNELKELKVEHQKVKEHEKELMEEVQKMIKLRSEIQDKLTQVTFEKTKLERSMKQEPAQAVNADSLKQLDSLKEEVKLLSMKQKQVIAYNAQAGSFEYIGEPVVL